MILATKPFSPPIDEFNEKVKIIFENNWFTNHGPMVTELENKLKSYFDAPYLVLVSNGTIALQIAIKALGLKGEIITTPYSYVATTSTIVWENCTPRFADINDRTLNIEPSKIPSLINEKTSAILATNVYGFPCDFEEIEKIARKNNLAVIYDNAHGFNSKYNGKSLLNYGDISTISFHATKLFHSVEGGAIVCQSKEIYEKLILLRNFGHTSPTSFNGMGINGKMNELSGAMGLVNLTHINSIINRRKEQWEFYFNSINTDLLKKINYDFSEVDFNYSYFPIFFHSERVLLKTLELLEQNQIYLRRYFYPSLNQLNYITVNDHCPISEELSKRVICLPLYHSLTEQQQLTIINLIQSI